MLAFPTAVVTNLSVSLRLRSLPSPLSGFSQGQPGPLICVYGFGTGGAILGDEEAAPCVADAEWTVSGFLALEALRIAVQSGRLLGGDLTDSVPFFLGFPLFISWFFVVQNPTVPIMWGVSLKKWGLMATLC